MTYRQLWLRLTTALAEARVLSQRRDVAVAAWDAIAVAIAAAQQIRRSEIVAIHAWSNATLAFNEATVAEAHLRIAQAGLDSKTMQGVTAAIRKATGREVASAASEAAEPAVKETVADRATAATPEAIDDGLTAEETAAAIESWRFRESGRFTGKNSPFESFDSPPGRF